MYIHITYASNNIYRKVFTAPGYSRSDTSLNSSSERSAISNVEMDGVERFSL
jgi:hypothetical protein